MCTLQVNKKYLTKTNTVVEVVSANGAGSHRFLAKLCDNVSKVLFAYNEDGSYGFGFPSEYDIVGELKAQ